MMACCAFAAFIIGQFLLLGDKLRVWLTRDSTPPKMSAAEWRLGLSETSNPQSPRKRAKRQIGYILTGLGIIGTAGAAFAASMQPMVELGQTGIYVPVCGDPGTLFNLIPLFRSI
jgi:hypothetical protein